MSLKTVTTLSAEWHEAVAAARTAPAGRFRRPGTPRRKSATMTSCRSTTAPPSIVKGRPCTTAWAPTPTIVQRGWQYVYSVRREGRRVATLAIERDATSTNAQLLSCVARAMPSHRRRLSQRCDDGCMRKAIAGYRHTSTRRRAAAEGGRRGHPRQRLRPRREDCLYYRRGTDIIGGTVKSSAFQALRCFTAAWGGVKPVLDNVRRLGFFSD